MLRTENPTGPVRKDYKRLRLNQIGALSPIVSGLVGILYFPFHASSQFLASDDSEFTGVISWSDAFADAAGSLLTFDSPEKVHIFYARFGFFVIAGFAAGALSLHSRQAQYVGRSGRWGFYLGATGISLLALSLFADRWLGAGDWTFLVLELPALLLMAPGLPLLGIATARARRVAPIGGWLLVFSVPGMILLTVIFGHLSAGILVLDVAWIVIGASLLSADSSEGVRIEP